MDKFTFESDEHGTFKADAEPVTMLINFWNFGCDPRVNVVPQPLGIHLVQDEVEKQLGHPAGHLADVPNRFAFAIILVDSGCDVESYMKTCTYAKANS